MSIKFTRRVAAEILGRGQNAIWIKPESLEDARKALTRDDVRKMIREGTVVAAKEKHELHKRAVIERRRGRGKRKGSAKARTGRRWEKKVRSQRLLLSRLREMQKVDSATFKRYYMLIKGNAFPDKRSLLLHLGDEGIKVTDDELKQITEYARSLYK